MKPKLFAAREREAKLTMLGDTLQVLKRHIDFAAMATPRSTKRPRDRAVSAGTPPFGR
jgi:hypothetical protein